MTVMCLANRKGGSGKSTAAVFLASLLAKQGRTLLIDSDPQGSLLSWSEEAGDGFPATVVAWPVRDLAKRVKDVAGDYQSVVIDTGRSPGAGDDPILRQALMASDVAVIPVAPSLIEVIELSRVLDMITEMEPLHQIRTHVLLTRVRAGTTSAKEARDGLAELPLLDAQIGLREMYSSAWGKVPTNAGEFAYALEEIQRMDAALV